MFLVFFLIYWKSIKLTEPTHEYYFSNIIFRIYSQPVRGYSTWKPTITSGSAF